MLSNESHGHVVPRPDGVKARCGGPALCPVCKAEKVTLELGGDEIDEILDYLGETMDPKLRRY